MTTLPSGLPVVVDRAIPTPLAAQISAQLQAAVTGGALRAGDRLPSSRDLSATLGVSRTVVTNAYARLFAEGWLEGRHGSGTYVADVTPPPPPTHRGNRAGPGAGRAAAGPRGLMFRVLQNGIVFHPVPSLPLASRKASHRRRPGGRARYEGGCCHRARPPGHRGRGSSGITTCNRGSRGRKGSSPPSGAARGGRRARTSRPLARPARPP